MASGSSNPFDLPCGRTRREFLWQAGNGFFGTAMAWMLAREVLALVKYWLMGWL